MSYECKYCLKKFKREGAFMKHRCKEMIRSEEIQSVRGQTAYTHYTWWMEAYKRKVPSIETFMTSKYYQSFINFVDFVNRLRIPSPDKYIQLMSKKDIAPQLWCRDECYSLYLEWLDRLEDPLDQAERTVDALYNLSEINGVHITEVFSSIHPRQIIDYIRVRKFSPWILLCSDKFKQTVQSMDSADRHILLEVIGSSYWSEKFAAKPQMVAIMKQITSEMGI